MAKGYIPGRIGGDDKVLARWQSYASDNSYHPSKADKTGNGPRKMQGSQGRMTGRDESCNCGPIGRHPGSDQDRGASNG